MTKRIVKPPSIAPKLLERGDQICIVSPAMSLALIPHKQRALAEERLRNLGLFCSYSKNAEVRDAFDSSPMETRISDLHRAFAERSVQGILTTLGGYNSSQLLGHLDYDLIRENPKIFCGFSDITALAIAIHVKTGLVTYSGPHFSTLGMKHGLEYTLGHFARCVMREGTFEVEPADHWSDDFWFIDQEARTFYSNPGYHILNEGVAEGILLGGHLGTLSLLFGTSFAPDLAGSILLLECDESTTVQHLDRELQSLILQPTFEGVRGVVFGRFPKASGIDSITLDRVVRAKRELANLPIVADASFGHTTPQFTFPVGGLGKLSAEDGITKLTIVAH